MSDEILIRRATTVADFQDCQRAQKAAWGLTDDSYLLSVAIMTGISHNGGLVLGAWTPAGEIVGLSCALLGRVDGRVCLYSQLTGIVPGFQGKGIGGRIKEFQRAFARSEGLDTITWTFDPLQAGNARFNLQNLGATSKTFIVNMYGLRTDALSAGAPTDRLLAEWPTTPDPSPRPDLGPIADLPRLIRFRPDANIPPMPDGTILAGTLGPVALLEIPDDIITIRRDDPARATAWTNALRTAFPDAFASGFRATGYHREDGRNFFVMRR